MSAFEGKSGKHLLRLSFSGFDPQQTLGSAERALAANAAGAIQSDAV
jgi:hypothetical protein